MLMILLSFFANFMLLSHEQRENRKPVTMGELVRFVMDQRLLTYCPLLPGLSEIRESHLGFLQTDLHQVVGYEQIFQATDNESRSDIDTLEKLIILDPAVFDCDKSASLEVRYNVADVRAIDKLAQPASDKQYLVIPTRDGSIVFVKKEGYKVELVQLDRNVVRILLPINVALANRHRLDFDLYN